MEDSRLCDKCNTIHKSRHYEVFLSFRGAEVRKTLVDHLHLSLSAAGLNVFLDSEKIEKGEIIECCLEAAIECSKIHIPIFSPTYATSEWCLNELLQMVKSQKTVIPLFYRVNSSEVECTDKKGPYAEAFRKHSTEGQDEDTIKMWKEALQKASLNSGWTMGTTGGYEGKFVKGVVMDILKMLNVKKLDVPKHCVGLEERMGRLMKLLTDCRGGVVKVGVWGMAGLGKTTLVKAVFNDIYLNFGASCFVSDIRECAKRDGMKELQMQMLKKLVNVDQNVSSVADGKAVMRRHLQSIQALVVLDDVDSQEQLAALIGDWFAEGSRIIITTRNQDILRPHVNAEMIYEVEELQDHEAVELFSWHAFLRYHPVQGYEGRSATLVKACDGLPLALEVLGSHLYGRKDMRFWEDAVKRIQHVGERKVYESLKISYDDLPRQEKEMFKDIACFFLGNEREIVTHFWESCSLESVYTSIENLRLKALITVSHDNRFDMHNQLRELGRELVAEEGYYEYERRLRSRLWHPRDAHLVLTQKDDACAVRGLRWGEYNGIIERKGLILPTEYLGSMANLELLVLEAKYIEDQLVKLPEKLKWLKLGQCTLKSLPSEWNMEHLVVLDLSGSKIVKLWNDMSNLKMPKNLRVLQLNNCYHLQKLPDFSNLKSLVRLELRECSLLSTIPYSIRCLQKLKYLDLSHHCNMSHCSSIRTLPDSIGFLKKLKNLDLSQCSNLKALPDSIVDLEDLYYLSLSKCRSLEGLPKMVNKLTSLETLLLDYTSNIKRLPNSIGEMKALRKLDMSYMQDLEELPSSLGGLSCLENLNLEGCDMIRALPSSIHQLKRLRYLNMNSCSRLFHLPAELGDLVSLEELLMERCHSFCELPQSIGNLGRLKSLKISGNTELRKLPKSFRNLGSLRLLTLSKMPTNLSSLRCLQLLQTNGCQIFEYGRRESTGDLLYKLFQVHLECQSFSSCVPNNLVKLFLHRCDDIVELSALPQQLEEAHITDCWRLVRIFTISNIRKLKVLNLSNCKRLTELPELGSLESLTEFNLNGCKGLESLAGMEKLAHLKILQMSECGVLPENLLHWIQVLPSLEEVSLCAERVPSCLEHKMHVREPAYMSVHEYRSVEQDSYCSSAVFCFVLEKGITDGKIKVCIDIDKHPDPPPVFMTQTFMDKEGMIEGDEVYAVCIYTRKHPLMKWFVGENTICCSTAMGKSWGIKAARLQLLTDGAEDAIFDRLAKDLSGRKLHLSDPWGSQSNLLP